jgi:hypothetical protein
MKPKVAELISIARRELRRASGVPLTVSEIEQDRRGKELKELQAFIYSKFSVSASYALNEEFTWHDGKAVVEFTVDEHKFRLRAVDNAFQFFAVTDPGEIQLLQLKGEDPQFSNRILVAIGDYVP